MLESLRSPGCALLHGSPDVPYSLVSPRRNMCNIYHSAGTMYDTFSRPCNSLLDDMRDGSLMSGNWVGLGSFSAADRAMRGHITHTADTPVYYVHGHSLIAQLRPSVKPRLLCDVRSISNPCRAPHVNSKSCVRFFFKKKELSNCKRLYQASRVGPFFHELKTFDMASLDGISLSWNGFQTQITLTI